MFATFILVIPALLLSKEVENVEEIKYESKATKSQVLQHIRSRQNEPESAHHGSPGDNGGIACLE